MFLISLLLSAGCSALRSTIMLRMAGSRPRRLARAMAGSVPKRLRGRANRRVAYVTSGSQKAVQPPLELPCVKSCAPIGASSYLVDSPSMVVYYSPDTTLARWVSYSLAGCALDEAPDGGVVHLSVHSGIPFSPTPRTETSDPDLGVLGAGGAVVRR